MAKVALIVNFTVKPQHLADFLTVIRAHAAGTLADEPGCVRFDVLTAADASPTVILVEVYADQAAYDLHRDSQRLRDVRPVYQHMIESRTLTLCDL